MALACENIPIPERFAPGFLSYLDCQAQSLGSQGYAALAAPGSTVSVVMTGMLTLLIALFGYRMLLGHVPGIRDGVLTIVKIGIVLTLATSWPAYQLLIYDVVLRSPAELATNVGGATGLPGTTGGLLARLDGVDQALKSLAIEGVGAPPIGADGQPILPSVAPSPFMGFDSFALWFSRVSFLVSTGATFAIVRLLAGLLLALGPLFALFLLFDSTRGLFVAWAQGLIGCALAAFATSIILGIELAFLEPWLATLVARRAAGLDILGSPAQLLATTTIFAITLFVVVALVARVATGLRILTWGHLAEAQQRTGVFLRGASGTGNAVPLPNVPLEGRTRAAAIVDAVASSDRRERSSMAEEDRSIVTASSGRLVPSYATGRARDKKVGSSGGERRRSGSRISSRATQRDRS